MEKSIHSADYKVFLRLLRDVRQQAGLSQEDIAEALGLTQSVVSKCERGERRVDILELRAWCQAVGVSFSSFAMRLDRELAKAR